MTDPEDIDPGENLVPERRDPEAPTEDAAEQAVTANPADEEGWEPPAVPLGIEVDEADAQEQARTVDLDDDYR